MTLKFMPLLRELNTYEYLGSIELDNNNQPITITANRQKAHDLLNGEPRQIPEIIHSDNGTAQTKKAMMPG
jgi:hypothetical protein